MKNKIKKWIGPLILLVVIILIVGFFILYPKSTYTANKVWNIEICYDGQYIELPMGMSIDIFERINRAKLVYVDFFYSGDDCGTDGPSIMVNYKDGTSDYWDYRGDGMYVRDVYEDGFVVREITIKSRELQKRIRELMEELQ